MLGPFWCQKENAWLRFKEAAGKTFIAEMAKMDKANSNITSNWEVAADGVWAVNYEEENELPVKYYYAFKQGIVYRRSGDSRTARFDGQYWVQYNTHRLDPQKDYIPFADSLDAYNAQNLLAYKQLPLTPEKVEEAKALEQQKWQQYQQNETLRAQYIDSADADEFFSKEQREALCVNFNTQMESRYPITPNHFEACADYILALQDIIQNENNYHHEEIENLIGSTYLDEALNIKTNDDQEMRQTLIKNKRAFFYNLLINEINWLCKEFNLPNPLAYQAAISFNNAQDIVYDDEFNEPNPFAYQAAVPYHNNQNDRAVDPLLIEIKTHFTQAQANYAKWYGEQHLYGGLSCFFAFLRPSGATLRGANGLLTYWRHGSPGQTKACNLCAEILNMETSEDAIHRINQFIRDKDTRSECHSFLSFALDELSQIQGSPWAGLKPEPNSNNRYNINAVLNQLGYAIPFAHEFSGF